jgi:hypothetical protein
MVGESHLNGLSLTGGLARDPVLRSIFDMGVPGVLEQKTSILCNTLNLLIYIGPIPIISTLAKQTAGDVDENLFHGSIPSPIIGG